MASNRDSFSRTRPGAELNGRTLSRGSRPAISRDREQVGDVAPRRSLGSRIAGVLIALVMLAVIALLVVAIMAQTGAFAIETIDTEGSEHVSAEQVAQLAAVETGTNLLSVDTATIAENIKRNPWVKDVDFAREFPSTLRITVSERTVHAVVLMNSGEIAWLLGDDDHWIEPLALDSLGNMTARDSGLAKARGLDCLFIENVPTTMAPEAGAYADDVVLADMEMYLSEFSQAFASQIIAFSISSENAISCTLANGVEISLGLPDGDVAEKEAVATRILEAHPNDVTYINVRIPSKPTYRKVGAPQPETQDDASDVADDGTELDGVDIADAEATIG